MPAIEYSRDTADNIFTRFHIMAFLYDDLEVIDVPINLRFFIFFLWIGVQYNGWEDGIRNKSSTMSSLYFLDFFHFLAFYKFGMLEFTTLELFLTHFWCKYI